MAVANVVLHCEREIRSSARDAFVHLGITRRLGHRRTSVSRRAPEQWPKVSWFGCALGTEAVGLPQGIDGPLQGG